jgi:hypothetical protein
MKTITNQIRPPSVADYFEQRLGAKLPPHPDDDDLDREHPASPAHPEFHIGTGCGEDCKHVIDAAAPLISYLRGGNESEESNAIEGADMLLTYLRGAFDDPDLVDRAHVACRAVRFRSRTTNIDEIISDVRLIAAEVVNCYVYG